MKTDRGYVSKRLAEIAKAAPEFGRRVLRPWAPVAPRFRIIGKVWARAR